MLEKSAGADCRHSRSVKDRGRQVGAKPRQFRFEEPAQPANRSDRDRDARGKKRDLELIRELILHIDPAVQFHGRGRHASSSRCSPI